MPFISCPLKELMVKDTSPKTNDNPLLDYKTLTVDHLRYETRKEVFFANKPFENNLFPISLSW